MSLTDEYIENVLISYTLIYEQAYDCRASKSTHEIEIII